ncbi:MAG: hypothetical protein HYT87_18280 [Nitrospirae bacterium]|nr:hypothetical protein [Nitrospirota bacterium]
MQKVLLFALCLILPACAGRSCSCENGGSPPRESAEGEVDLVIPLTAEQAAMVGGIQVVQAHVGVDNRIVGRSVPGQITSTLHGRVRAIGAPDPVPGAPPRLVAPRLPWPPIVAGPEVGVPHLPWLASGQSRGGFAFLAPRRQTEAPQESPPTGNPAFRTRLNLPDRLTEGRHLFFAILLLPSDPSIALVEASATFSIPSDGQPEESSLFLEHVSLPSGNTAGLPNLVQAFAQAKAPELGLDPSRPAAPLSDEHITNIVATLSPHLEASATAVAQILLDAQEAPVVLVVDPTALAAPSVTSLLCEVPANEPCGSGKTLSATTVLFNFGCDRVEACSFECAKDDGAFASCDAPLLWAELTPGVHQFSVHARDTKGREGPASTLTFFTQNAPDTRRSISADAGPLPQFTQTPSSESEATVTFRFTCDTVCLWSCSWDGLPFRACSPPYVLSNLASGGHAFSVRATDTNGTSASAITHAWSVAGSNVPSNSSSPAPSADPPQINQAPPALTPLTSATFSFEVSTDLDLECSLDGGPYLPCASPYVVTGLSPGLHVLQVRSIASNGEVSPTPVSHAWTVDNLAPAAPDPAKLTVAQNAPGTSDTVNGAGGAVEANAIVKAWADGLLTMLIQSRSAEGDGSFAAISLGDNALSTVYLTATDAAGNQSKASTVTNDTAPPTNGSISHTDGYYKTLSIPVTFNLGTDSGTGILQSLIERRTASLAAGTCSSYGAYATISTNPPPSPYTDTSVASGSCYQYRLVVSDAAGQTAEYTSSATARVDSEAPSTLAAVNDGTGGDIDIQATTISLSANWAASTDPASGVERYEYCLSTSTTPGVCAGIDSAYQQLGNVTSFTRTPLALAEGTVYYVHVRVKDNAGHYTATTVSDGVKADATPPSFAGAATAVPISTNRIDLAWTAATDNVSSGGAIVYDICQSTASGSCAAGFTATATTTAGTISMSMTGLTQATRYYFVVRAKDEAGNSDSNATEMSAITWGPVMNAVSAHLGEHSCALAGDGSVRCWGTGSNGQLGDGTTLNSFAPVMVSSLSNAVSLTGGYMHTCALMLDGTARCWGRNQYGQLGDGTSVSKSTPVAVSTLTGAVALAGGGYHVCALVSDGTARCWGANFFGDLGDGTSINKLTPIAVSTLTQAVALTGGSDHTCALLSDGAAHCWGVNTKGQLGDGSTTDKNVPTAVSTLSGVLTVAAGGTHTCATVSDGSALCWGLNNNRQLGDGTTVDKSTPVAVSTLSGAVSVTGGNSHSCALVSDGTIRCWGRGGEGQLGNGATGASATPVTVSSITSAVRITTGTFHNCALLADGATRCWGYNPAGQLGDGTSVDRSTPVAVSGLGGPMSVLARSPHDATPAWIGAHQRPNREGLSAHLTYHTCALVSDGRVKCWGYNLYGQLGDGSTADKLVPVSVSSLTGALSITEGNYHTCALVSDGTARCWGLNNNGQLGDGSAAGKTTPITVSSLTGATALSGGNFHTCAAVSDGTVRCWGRNSSGQLGDGSTTDRSTPTTVSTLTSAVAVLGGGSHACALTANGTVSCWGLNDNGQLGDGSTNNKSTPVVVSTLTDAVALAAGLYHSCALIADGTVRCWGRGADGRIGDGGSTNRPTPVAVSTLTGAVAATAGGSHSCAVLSGGSITCWGDNTFGQLGDGTTADKSTPISVSSLSSAVAATAGADHTCAILSDGTVRCWGRNVYGGLGDSTTIDRLTPVAVQSLP